VPADKPDGRGAQAEPEPASPLGAEAAAHRGHQATTHVGPQAGAPYSAQAGADRGADADEKGAERKLRHRACLWQPAYGWGVTPGVTRSVTRQPKSVTWHQFVEFRLKTDGREGGGGTFAKERLG
jgi:hypothetical protein